MSAYVLKTNGEKVDIVPQARGEELRPTTFHYTELQDVVGGYIEIIRLTDEVFMVVDEEGKLKDYYVNVAATEIFRKCFPKSNDYIVGDVLICSSDMID